MTFFKKKQKDTTNSIMNVIDIYVITSQITSSYVDGHGGGPYNVTMYFLAKLIDNEYHELFSNEKIEKKEESKNKIFCECFDTPYVIKAEPLKKYLINENLSTVDIHFLFEFITNMNANQKLINELKSH